MGENWTPTDETYDYEGAVCPACGRRHGDCFEWLNDESEPVDFDCAGCGAKLKGEVSYSVSYTTTIRGSHD